MALYTFKPFLSANRRIIAVRLAALLIPALLMLPGLRNLSPEESRLFVRYLILAFTALTAIITPHLLFPEPRIWLLRLANFNSVKVFKFLLWRMRWFLISAVWFLVVILFSGLLFNRTGLLSSVPVLADGVLFIAGLYLFAQFSYVRLGYQSQQWQEGTRGEKLRRMKRETGQITIDPGSVPTLLTTIQVALTGFLLYLVAVKLRTSLELPLYGLPGILLLVYSLFRWRTLKKALPSYWYRTEAFFREYLNPSTTAEERKERALTVDSLYWIPKGRRPAAWAALKQLDRSYPFGRYIFIVHAFFWFILLQGYEEFWLEIYLLGMAAFKQIPLLLLRSRHMSPALFNLQMQSVFRWTITRFFMQLRWLVPFWVSLLLAVWNLATWGWMEFLGWTGIYIAVTLLGAWLVTLFSENSYEGWKSD